MYEKHSLAERIKQTIIIIKDLLLLINRFFLDFWVEAIGITN